MVNEKKKRGGEEGRRVSEREKGEEGGRESERGE
jgi:hypothetical protein